MSGELTLGTPMKIDLDGIRGKLGSELTTIEKRQAHLEQLLGHLSAVQRMVRKEPIQKPNGDGLDMSGFRRAVFGEDR